jgi:hypothetical protein
MQVDSWVVSWLYTTVFKETVDAMYDHRNSAHSAWTTITRLFFNNSLQCAVYAY